MPTIKIKLEREELNAVTRRAAEFGTTAEALAFGALSYAMSQIKEDAFRAGVLQAVNDMGGDLPLWSDSAPSAYEGAREAEEPGPQGGPL